MKRQHCFVMLILLLLLLAGCQSYSVSLDNVYYPTPRGKSQDIDGTSMAEPQMSGDVAATPQPVVTSRPVVTPSPTPARVAPDSTAVTYTVRPGDNLLQIAILYGTTVESLMSINGLSNADQLSVGQVLQVSFEAQVTGPERNLLPDSEIVFSPAFTDFNVQTFLNEQAGYLATYSETVGYEALTGAQIVELVALQYSVGPRILLAMLEFRSGWITQADPAKETLTFPLGYTDQTYYTGLYHQLCVAADSLNTGFYGWQNDSLWMVQTRDGTFIGLSEQINAGTAAVHRALAGNTFGYESWVDDVDALMETYDQLFGDPYRYAIEPLISPMVEPLSMVLPWPEADTWYYTGGPHAGFGTIGAGSAVDFVTGEQNIGCWTSQYWSTAIADGLVVYSHDGMVLVDSDGDGNLTTGWVIMYMHMDSDGRVDVGDKLEVGDPIGHPSCEGGVSYASHLHLARRYNGMWIAADDKRFPLILSGWQAEAGSQAYDGFFVRNGVTRTACECWDDEINGMSH